LKGSLTLIEQLIKSMKKDDKETQFLFKKLVDEGIYDRGSLGMNMNLTPLTSHQDI